MMARHCRVRFIRSFLLLLVAAGVTWADPVEFKGYYKHFLSLTDAHDNLQNIGLTDEDLLVDSLQRLRIEATFTPRPWWDVHAAYEVRTAWGDSVRVREQAEKNNETDLLFSTSPRARFLDLDHEVVEESNFTLVHLLDRLRLRIQNDNVQLRLGRQAVSWGSGLIWTPNDLFVGFAPDAIDVDEKPGVDVVRVIFTPDLETTFDLVAEPLDADDTLSVDSDDSSLAGRGTTHIGEYDVAVSGGSIAGDTILGADFSGYLVDAGLRGDLVYTWVEEPDEPDYLKGVLSIDYSFAARWDPYAALEYFYNGLGTDDPDRYLERRADDSVQRAFDRGTAFNLGRNYLGGLFRLTPTALVTLSSTTLWNLDDGSLLEFATVSRSLSDVAELIFGANFGVGPSGTEFGGFSAAQAGTEFRNPDFYYAFLKYYF